MIHHSLFVIDFTNTTVNLYFIIHPMCGNLPSAVICLKSTFSVFVPHYSLFAMTYDACRRKVKWGNHSQLKKTERKTSIHFKRFINKWIIPLPQGFFCHFWLFCWVTNPRGRILFNLFLPGVHSHCMCKEFVLQKWWNLIQAYCDRKQTCHPELIKHGTAAIVWMWDTMG